MNAISWFEIPASDFDRAKGFYAAILGSELKDMPKVPGSDNKIAALPFDWEDGSVGGAIVEGEGYNPSSDGAILYLNAGNDLDGILGRVEDAGGKIVIEKMSIGEWGEMAAFMDTEGNVVRLHSPS